MLPCIPESKVPAILHEAHDNGGHWGIEAILAKLRGYCYWPDQSTDTRRYIRGCLPCARHGPALRSAPLHPVKVIGPMVLLGMDFVGPLQRTIRGSLYILHIMDYFSRYLWAFPTIDPTVEAVMACLTSLFLHMPLPWMFYVDRGQHFDNERLRQFLRSYQVLVTYSPSGSSQSTGMIEKGNDLLEMVLRKDPREWDIALPNSVTHSNNKVIPHLHHSSTAILVGLPPRPLAS